MMRKRLNGIVAMIAFLLAAPLASAQDVRAAIEEGQKYVGQPFVMEIQVSNARQVATPVVPSMPSFEVSVGTRSEQSFNINGRKSRTIGYRFNVTPLESGRLQIPAFSVMVDGRRMESQPFMVDVRQPGPSDNFELRAAFDVGEAYVGQPVRLRLTILFNGSAEDLRIAVPGLSEYFDIEDRPAHELQRYTQRGMRLAEFNIEGIRATGVPGQGSMRGQQVRSYSIELVAVPRQSGHLDIGPAVLNGVEITQSRSRIDRMMGRGGLTKPFAVASGPIPLNVLELPVEGAPPDFEGLVGSFDISAIATPREVNVGDPITLNVYVTGDEPLDRVDDLHLERNSELTRGFRLPSESSPPKMERGAYVFTHTIRAADDDVIEIPPIGFWHFDPEIDAYVYSQTDPIPLTVHPTRELTLADAEGGVIPDTGTALESRSGGIMHNFTTVDALNDQSFDLATAIRSPATIAAVSAPVGLYAACGVIALSRRRSKDVPRSVRRRRALGRAERTLRHDEAPAEARVQSALHNYIADAFDRPAAGLTTQECEQLLSECEASNRTAFVDLLRRADQLRYAGATDEAGDALVEDAIVVIRGLDQEVSKS